MKRLKMIVVMLCLTILASCSSPTLGLGSNGESVIDHGKKAAVDQHEGIKASKGFYIDPALIPAISIPAEGFKIEYVQCTTQDFCVNTSAPIDRSDWIKYKNAHYVVMNGDTFFIMHKQITEDYAVCGTFRLPEFECATPADVTRAMYEGIENLTLGTDYTVLSFKDKVLVNIEGLPNYIARPASILIKDTILVKEGVLDRTDETVTIQDKALGKLTDGAYDYYQYESFLIQVRSGLDINSLVTLK